MSAQTQTKLKVHRVIVELTHREYQKALTCARASDRKTVAEWIHLEWLHSNMQAEFEARSLESKRVAYEAKKAKGIIPVDFRAQHAERRES